MCFDFFYWPVFARNCNCAVVIVVGGYFVNCFAALFIDFILLFVLKLMLAISIYITIFGFINSIFLLDNSICCLLVKINVLLCIFLFLLDLYFWHLEYFSYKYFDLVEFVWFYVLVLLESVLFVLDYPVPFLNVLYCLFINCTVLLWIWFYIIGHFPPEYYYWAVVFVVGGYFVNGFWGFVFKFYVIVLFDFVAGYFCFYCHVLFDYLYCCFWVILFVVCY